MAQNNRKTGSHYEDQVAAFLEQNGFTIIERNFRCRSGEIDLIARDGDYLVFIEVKFRKNSTCGTSLEAIDFKKAAQIRKIAAIYLYQKRYPENTPCRFDAAGVDGDKITYMKNAF
ncbi:MAG: YraN family protein [Lachnospiraceae bacterium]|nr:YraN family protein [Lachnospiraceae bacterium]MBQ6857241.1 YraN family protein [Lachnospiraceae bacterium]